MTEREKQKKELESRLVSFDENNFVKQTHKKPIKNKKQKKIWLIIILIVVLLLFLFFLFIRKFNFKITLFSKTLSQTQNSIKNNNVLYKSFDKGLIRYSSDGASFIDKNGSTKWSVTYNMSSPVIETKGDYAMILDSKGVNVYLFTVLGRLTNIKSDNVIDKWALSEEGDVALLVREKESSFVRLYDRIGKTGDVYIKYANLEDGIPLDISLSNDGKKIIVSLCKMNEDNISSFVKVYNFNEKEFIENDDRIVGDIKENFEKKLVQDVEFLDNDNAVCFFDGGVAFVNIKDDKISITNKLVNDNKYNIIHSIFVEKNMTYIVYSMKEEIENEKYPYLLCSYEKYGKVKLRKKIKKNFLDFYVTNGISVFVGIDNVLLVDNFGIVRYDGILVNNFVYLSDLFCFEFMDVLVGVDNSIKRLILY